MGSEAWTDALSWRLLDSAKYRDSETFVIARGERSWTGTIEFGHSGGRPCIYVREAGGVEVVVRLDARTLIDGVPAKEWRE